MKMMNTSVILNVVGGLLVAEGALTHTRETDTMMNLILQTNMMIMIHKVTLTETLSRILCTEREVGTPEGITQTAGGTQVIPDSNADQGIHGEVEIHVEDIPLAGEVITIETDMIGIMICPLEGVIEIVTPLTQEDLEAGVQRGIMIMIHPEGSIRPIQDLPTAHKWTTTALICAM